MIKVLVISHMFPSTFDEISGIFVYEQAEALIKKGVEIRVISPVPWVPFPINRLSFRWKRYGAIPKNAHWERIPVWYPRYLNFPRAWFFEFSGQRMYQGIKKIVSEIYSDFKFEVIHAHALLPDGYAGMLFQKKTGIPCIVTIHGSDLLLYPHKNKKSYLYTLKVLQNASKIITVSSYLKSRCRDKFSIPDEKLEVIYNGFDDELFYLEEKNSGQEKKPDQKITFLFIGHIIRSKGVFDLLSAIQIIGKTNKKLSKKLSWVIIGQGADLAEFKEESSRLNDEVDLKVMGQLPHKKVSEFMKVSDFVILPSWSEGLSVVLLEAVACGLPVIATKVGGIPEIVDRENGILIDPQDPAMLARGILNALSKDWNRQLISENAKKYSWEKNTEKTLKVYQEVLGYAR